MSKKIRRRPGCGIGGAPDRKVTWNNLLYAVDGETIGRARSPDRAGAVRKQKIRAIPHNSKCRYGERGAAAAKPKAQIILDAAKVSAASGGNSEPKQGQRSQSARGFCPRSTMRVPQPDIIEHFGNADAVPQPPERCLSRKAGIVRCCLKAFRDSVTRSVKIYGLYILIYIIHSQISRNSCHALYSFFEPRHTRRSTFIIHYSLFFIYSFNSSLLTPNS